MIFCKYIFYIIFLYKREPKYKLNKKTQKKFLVK